MTTLSRTATLAYERLSTRIREELNPGEYYATTSVTLADARALWTHIALRTRRINLIDRERPFIAWTSGGYHNLLILDPKVKKAFITLSRMTPEYLANHGSDWEREIFTKAAA